MYQKFIWVILFLTKNKKIDLVTELKDNNNNEKNEEYLKLRESIENRIEEIDKFFELNFDKPYVFYFEKGRIRLKKLLMYEPTLLNQLDNGKDFKGIAFGIQSNQNLENNNLNSINELNLKNENEIIKNVENKTINNNLFNYDKNKKQLIQKLNFNQLINSNENIHKKLNRSVEKNYNNPIDSNINLYDNTFSNLNINNNNAIINKKNSRLQQFTQKKENLNYKEISLNNENNNNKNNNKKIIVKNTNQNNKIAKIQSKNKNIGFNKKNSISNEKESSVEKKNNKSIINKIELGHDYFPNKGKSKYNPNNNPFNGEMLEKFTEPNENYELKEIVLKFKLTEEEYKLLLKEKAKLINPIGNKYNKKIKYNY